MLHEFHPTTDTRHDIFVHKLLFIHHFDMILKDITEIGIPLAFYH